ncbi:UNVERIFIED_CONTAM: hypothetical protein Sindi_2487900, partial [Sesamum indicum]
MADSSAMEAEQCEKEVLYLHPFDNSSFVLAFSSLNASNFLTWSRRIYIALGCKMKIAFIDRTFPLEESGPYGHFVSLEYDLEGHRGGFH